jgi:hypothetical protein
VRKEVVKILRFSLTVSLEFNYMIQYMLLVYERPHKVQCITFCCWPSRVPGQLCISAT